jgi:hypothetical protein
MRVRAIFDLQPTLGGMRVFPSYLVPPHYVAVHIRTGGLRSASRSWG